MCYLWFFKSFRQTYGRAHNSSKAHTTSRARARGSNRGSKHGQPSGWAVQPQSGVWRGDLYQGRPVLLQNWVPWMSCDRCVFVRHLKTNFLQTFQLNISTRYYWRKSSVFQGIRLTKVSTKWPQINHVDAAAEVPYKDLVYLFEGKFHRDSFCGLIAVVAPLYKLNMSLYRQQILGHQGSCEDNHARLPKASFHPRPPLLSQQGGCSRLSVYN